MVKNRFAFLDGIRGVAAILVLMRHTQPMWGFNFFHSFLAVDLFFILSGFVIAHSYASRMDAGEITPRKFLALRFIRLYPMYILALGIAMALSFAKLIVGSEGATQSILGLMVVISLNAMFLPSRLTGSDYLFPVNSPSWSLFFEMIANIVYAILQRFISNKVLCFIVALAAIGVGYSSHLKYGLDLGYTWGAESFFGGISRSIFGFFSGVLIYNNHEKILSRVKIKATPWIGFFGAMVVMMLPKSQVHNDVVDVFLVIVALPLFTLFMVQQSNSRIVPFLLVLGASSYPLYVLHVPISMIVLHLIKSHPYAPYSGIIFTTMLVMICVFLERKIDMPLRKWMVSKLINV